MNSEVFRKAIRIFSVSRLFILAVGVVALLALPLNQVNEAKFDDPSVTQPLGSSLSLWARWDSVWYLEIADDGYSGNRYQAAFFPLYPMLVRALALPLGGFQITEASLLVAALAISLGALLAALYLLGRLVEVELGPRLVTPTLMLVAFFPMAFFLNAAYSESLFLLLSVGSFYFARTGRWAWAGVFGALAAATRSAGVLLIFPLAILYLWGPSNGRGREEEPRRRSLLERLRPRQPIRANALWLGLVPAGLGAYVLYLADRFDEPLRFASAQSFWLRRFLTPFGGIYEGASAAFQGARQLLHASREPVYWASSGGDPFSVAGQNLETFGFMVLALVALVGTFKLLPLAYGLYSALLLALPLSFPAKATPLMSFPRMVVVVFPLFMWAAVVLERRGWTQYALVASALLLAFFTSLWAGWNWVS